MSKIAILGAGVYGTALGGVLARNGYDIDYYDPLKEKERLKDVMADAKAAVLVVPSATAIKLLPHIPKDIFLVVATKGFLSETPFLDFRKWGVLSGAGFAKDFNSGKDLCLTATDEKILELFKSAHLKFDFTTDRLGVLMCGALKNVYALLAGRLGLKPGTKKMYDYILAASNEMGMILKQNGASIRTLRLSCGVKDLILTCSPNSRNYSFGLSLKDSSFKNPGSTVESLTTIKRIERREIELPGSVNLLKQLLEDYNATKC